MTLAQRVRRGIVYHGACAIQWFVERLPRPLAGALGSWVGLTAWWVIRRDQYRVDRHLRLVWHSDLSAGERHRIGRDFYVHSARNFVDLLRARRYFSTEVTPKVTAKGLAAFDAAYRRGNGVIGITGHLGNWELLAVWMAQQGYRVAVVARDLYHSGLQRKLITLRQGFGVTTFSTDAPFRELVAWLRAGGVLGVLIDTDSQRVRSIPVPFLGRKAMTPVGPSILARRTGAVLIPVALLRIDSGGYELFVKDPVEVPSSESGVDSDMNVMLQCNNALREIIATHPDQWIWLGNRWRTPC
jgi:KDO2-lipid IV(A) lauroyltransferase